MSLQESLDMAVFYTKRSLVPHKSRFASLGSSSASTMSLTPAKLLCREHRPMFPFKLAGFLVIILEDAFPLDIQGKGVKP